MAGIWATLKILRNGKICENKDSATGKYMGGSS